MGIFDPENKFWVFMEKVANTFFLSLLWLLFSLPIITAGSATTACYSFLIKSARDEEGYLFRSFYRSFKKNFWQSTLVWLLAIAVGLVLFYDYLLLFNMPTLGSFRVLILSVLFVLSFLYLVIVIYIFPLIAMYQVKTKKAIKDALIIGFQYPLITLLEIAIIALVFVATYYLVPFFFIWFILGSFLSSFLLSYVFNALSEEL